MVLIVGWSHLSLVMFPIMSLESGFLAGDLVQVWETFGELEHVDARLGGYQ